MLLGQLPPRRDHALPVWEHGYRCHGFWYRDNNQRMGYVGLSPPGTTPVIYTWGLDDPEAKPRHDGEPPARGEASSLRSAKRAVVRAFRHYYSWMFPETRGY